MRIPVSPSRLSPHYRVRKIKTALAKRNFLSSCNSLRSAVIWTLACPEAAVLSECSLSPKRHVTVVGDSLGCLHWSGGRGGLLLASGAKRSEMLLSVPQFRGQPPITKIDLIQNVNSVEVEKSCYTARSTLSDNNRMKERQREYAILPRYNCSWWGGSLGAVKLWGLPDWQ